MNYIVFEIEFTCTATGKTYKLRSDLTFKNDNVRYLISGKSASNSMLALSLKVILSPGLEFTKVT